MTESDKEIALLVKRFGKFIKKKGYRSRRRKTSSKKQDEDRRYFWCGSKHHLVVECPYSSYDEDAHKK